MKTPVILSKAKNLIRSVVKRGSSLRSERLLLAIFLLGITAIFRVFLSDFGLGESGYNFLGKTKKVALSPGLPVSQIFTAHENGLYQVRFVLGNVNLRHGEHIGLTLMDGICVDTIAFETITSEPTGQGAYTVFRFPAIPDSAGKKYCFRATFFSDRDDVKGNKPELSATQNPDPAFADRLLIDMGRGKTYESQTLFLRPAYTKGSLRADLGTLLDRLSQYKPAYMKSWPIATLFAITVIGSLLLGIRIIRL